MRCTLLPSILSSSRLLCGILLLFASGHRQTHAFVAVPRALPRAAATQQQSSPLFASPAEWVDLFSPLASNAAAAADAAAAVQQQSSLLFLVAAATTTEYPVSPEPIHTAFQIGTNFGQPFFLLMIFFPKASITKKIMGGFEIPLLYALIHFVIVASSIAVQGSGVTAPLSELNDVFDPTGDAQQAFMNMVTNYPNFVAEEWIHTLSWDLFVGRYIWLDGLKRGILTAPAVLFADLIGPPGLLIYFITCLLSGKPILDKTEKEELENL